MLQHFEAWEGVCGFGDLELKRRLRHGNGWVDRLFLRNSYVESVLTSGCALHSKFQIRIRKNNSKFI